MVSKYHHEKVVILFFLLSCQTELPHGEKYYRKNMVIEVNGKSAVGTMVLGHLESNKYEIKAKFKESIERIEFTSCHRFHAANKIGKKWEYVYQKNPDLEGVGVCLVDIMAKDEKLVGNRWAILEFVNGPHLNLKAKLGCNGDIKMTRGVSICQSQFPLKQSIEFSEEVEVDPNDECPPPYTYNNKLFRYDINRGNCIYLFEGKSGFHRHVAYGYDDVL